MHKQSERVARMVRVSECAYGKKDALRCVAFTSRMLHPGARRKRASPLSTCLQVTADRIFLSLLHIDLPTNFCMPPFLSPPSHHPSIYPSSAPFLLWPFAGAWGRHPPFENPVSDDRYQSAYARHFDVRYLVHGIVVCTVPMSYVVLWYPWYLHNVWCCGMTFCMLLRRAVMLCCAQY